MTKRRSVVLIVVVAALAAFFVVRAFSGGSSPKELSLDAYANRLEQGDVASATIHDQDHRVTGELKGGTDYEVDYPDRYTTTITQDIVDAGVNDVHTDHQSQSPWLNLLFSLLPFLLLALVLLWVLGQVQGGGRVMGFGKSRAKLVSKDQPKVTFSDVAGLDEAVEELEEIKDFLAAPAKFQDMGAKIPKGVLLFGPPGTGKTLLAKAVAGEAGVPFFSISGSDFVEMFVGVGASRVRDLFEQAKNAAPAIVFVDEIDAVGRHRGAGLGGGHDEREQTLNQLLVEMDGFDQKQGVILLASTNRPDILDPALLRPGRFDRQIVVDRPDLEGRKAILAVHARGKPFADGVDLDVIARRTPGFTGADLANLVNEAALLSARHDLKLIGLPQLEEAIDRVMAGPERRSRLISEREKRVDRVPRRRARAGRARAAQHGSGAQDLDHPSRPRPRLHAHAPHRRQVPRDEKRARRRVGDAARRPYRGGADLRRPDHRCPERHRPRHDDRAPDGHRVRDERRARSDALRPSAGRGVPRS